MEDIDEVLEAGMARMKRNRKRFEELYDLLEEKEVAERRQRIHILLFSTLFSSSSSSTLLLALFFLNVKADFLTSFSMSSVFFPEGN